MPTFKIVPGFTRENERVFRVVEYQDGTCLGGRGSYFERINAEAQITFLSNENVLANLPALSGSQS